MAGLQDVHQHETNGTRFDDVLSVPARRQLIQRLEDQGEASEAELAEELAARSSDGEPAVRTTGREPPNEETRRHEATVPSEPHQQHQIRLQHDHLPKLAEAGLVIWDRTERSVSATDRCADVCDQWADLVALDDEADGAATGQTLSNRQRRAVLAIAGSNDGPVSRDRLARELATADGDSTVPKATVRDVAIHLHHCHLPKLEEAGLIHYDADDATVTYCGPSTLPARPSTR